MFMALGLGIVFRVGLRGLGIGFRALGFIDIGFKAKFKV